jgi:hypothetical protein
VASSPRADIPLSSSGAELPEMMVDVLVHQPAPVGRGHRAEEDVLARSAPVEVWSERVT